MARPIPQGGPAARSQQFGRVGTAGMQAALYHARRRRVEALDPPPPPPNAIVRVVNESETTTETTVRVLAP